jgi:hypothetical protein
MFTLSVVLLHRHARTAVPGPNNNKGMIKLMKEGYFHCADKGKGSYVSSSTGTILMENKALCLY